MKTALVFALTLAAAGAVQAEDQQSDQHRARQSDIDYYTQRYDGADVALARFNCVKPDIPARSETKQDIKAVGAGIDAWMACYNGFVKKLHDVLPVGKAIPDDLVDLMTDDELKQALSRLDHAYAAVYAEGKQRADQIMAAREAWQTRTNEFVATENARTQQVALVQQTEARNGASTARASGPSPTLAVKH
jgi:predicted RNA-binding protein with RPS1 domain